MTGAIDRIAQLSEHDLATEPLERYAATYALDGIEVFPVNPTDKTPLISQKLATTDLAVVAAWWERWPGALIGHRVAPDQVILDVDPRHGGEATWEALEDEFGPIPVGRMHFSGRGDGGFHAWFPWPDGLLRPSTKRLTEWAQDHEVGAPVLDRGTGKPMRWTCGIDLLTNGWRYSILPPSPHPDTGKPYYWRERSGELGAMPDALAELLAPVDGHGADQGEAEDDAQDEDEDRPRLSVPLHDLEHSDSIADWFTATRTWASILVPHGWTLVQGDGDRDGSLWRHPDADPAHKHSASIRHGLLFVYSANTVFEPTEDGDPNGYTPFRAWAVLEHGGNQAVAARAARALKNATGGPAVAVAVDQDDEDDEDDDGVMRLVNWSVAHDPPDDLVDGIAGPGRWTQFVAPAKGGKSTLLMAMSVELSEGRDPFDGSPVAPVTVLYLDGEMGQGDVEELVRACGADPALLTRWHAADERPRLDGSKGAARLLACVDRVGADLVVFDGLNGFIDPEASENDDTTWRRFYGATVVPLKKRGVTILSGDNMGKEPQKGARGSSVKADKADAVFVLKRTEQGVRLHPTHRRSGFTGDDVDLDVVGLDRSVPILYRHAPSSWLAGAKDAAAVLDRLGVPLDQGREKVRTRLRSEAHAADVAGRDPGEFRIRNEVLAAALRYRRAIAVGKP